MAPHKSVVHRAEIAGQGGIRRIVRGQHGFRQERSTIASGAVFGVIGEESAKTTCEGKARQLLVTLDIQHRVLERYSGGAREKTGI